MIDSAASTSPGVLLAIGAAVSAIAVAAGWGLSRRAPAAASHHQRGYDYAMGQLARANNPADRQEIFDRLEGEADTSNAFGESARDFDAGILQALREFDERAREAS